MAMTRELRRRLSHGGNAAIVTFCVLAMLVLVYRTADKHRVRLDLSLDTTSGLQTDTLHKLKLIESGADPLTITAFSAQQGKRDAYFKNRALKDLLDEIDFATKDVRCRFIDFDRDRLTAESLGVKAYGTVIVQHGEDRLDIKDRALFRRRGSGKNQRLEFLGEAAVAQALGQLLSERVRPIYALTGHGELDFDSSEPDGLSVLGELLAREGYALRALDLLRDSESGGAPQVPADAAAILLARPSVPLTETENRALEAFVSNGGAIVAMLDVGSVVPQIVRRLGIDVPNGYVMDKLRVFPYDDRPVGRYKRHPINTDLSEDELVTVFAHVAPLTIRKDAPKSVRLMPLLTTSRDGWIERGGSLQRGSPIFDAGVDVGGKINMAIAAQGLDDKGRETGGRFVVLGDAEVLTNSLIGEGPGNATFGVNVFRWAIGDDERLSVVGRPTRVRNVTLTEKDAKLLRWVTLALGPGLVILLGTAVWVGRRGR
jgi:hypothetical protein